MTFNHLYGGIIIVYINILLKDYSIIYIIYTIYPLKQLELSIYVWFSVLFLTHVI